MKIDRALLLCLCVCLLLTGCASSSAPLTLSCAEIADLVQAADSFAELTDAAQKYMERHLLIEAESLEDWVMRRDASQTTPETVLILRVKAGADQAAVKKAVQDYRDEQLRQYRDYLPEQTFMLENAKVLENGAYIALIVAPDAAKAIAALGGGWK